MRAAARTSRTRSNKGSRPDNKSLNNRSQDRSKDGSIAGHGCCLNNDQASKYQFSQWWSMAVLQNVAMAMVVPEAVILSGRSLGGSHFLLGCHVFIMVMSCSIDSYSVCLYGIALCRHPVSGRSDSSHSGSGCFGDCHPDCRRPKSGRPANRQPVGWRPNHRRLSGVYPSSKYPGSG